MTGGTGVGSLASAVRELFRRMDGRELAAFAGSFEPGALIVHDDGRATTPEQMTKALDGAPPVRRRLAEFRGETGTGLGWVAYENRVTFRLDDGTLHTLRFSETALLKRREDGWRFVRIHYSGDRRP